MPAYERRHRERGVLNFLEMGFAFVPVPRGRFMPPILLLSTKYVLTFAQMLPTENPIVKAFLVVLLGSKDSKFGIFVLSIAEVRL